MESREVSWRPETCQLGSGMMLARKVTEISIVSLCQKKSTALPMTFWAGFCQLYSKWDTLFFKYIETTYRTKYLQLEGSCQILTHDCENFIFWQLFSGLYLTSKHIFFNLLVLPSKSSCHFGLVLILDNAVLIRVTFLFVMYTRM